MPLYLYLSVYYSKYSSVFVSMLEKQSRPGLNQKTISYIHPFFFVLLGVPEGKKKSCRNCKLKSPKCHSHP